MSNFLRALGFLWLLPATVLVWTFYVLPVWATGNIEFEEAKNFVVVFKLKKRDSWYARLWKKWWGWSGPCVYIYRDTGHILEELSEVNELYKLYIDEQVSITKKHELRHCDQQFVFGPLHYPLYFICSAGIWIWATATNADKHSYLDNPFEKDARKHAGQMVNIPRAYWPDGKNDRNPWW